MGLVCNIKIKQELIYEVGFDQTNTLILQEKGLSALTPIKKIIAF